MRSFPKTLIAQYCGMFASPPSSSDTPETENFTTMLPSKPESLLWPASSQGIDMFGTFAESYLEVCITSVPSILVIDPVGANYSRGLKY